MTTIILRGDAQRHLAFDAVSAAPVDSVVTIKPLARTNDQNAKMWAMLSDVVKAAPNGRRWTAETWKCAFMHALGWQMEFCESIEGNSPFPLGYKSSRLSKAQMARLIERIYEFGAANGVQWSEEYHG